MCAGKEEGGAGDFKGQHSKGRRARNSDCLAGRFSDHGVELSGVSEHCGLRWVLQGSPGFREIEWEL